MEIKMERKSKAFPTIQNWPHLFKMKGIQTYRLQNESVITHTKVQTRKYSLWWKKTQKT